jgi:hypothetical protein
MESRYLRGFCWLQPHFRQTRFDAFCYERPFKLGNATDHLDEHFSRWTVPVLLRFCSVTAPTLRTRPMSEMAIYVRRGKPA